MIKDLIKTLISVLVLSLLIFVTFIVISKAKYALENDEGTPLAVNDPIVEMLYSNLTKNDELRLSSFTGEKLDNEKVIKYIIQILTKNDYKTKKYKAKKIICEINSSISFNPDKTNGECSVMVISNNKFTEYQKKLFNRDTKLEFIDFEYRGYLCKNDGKNYYCTKHNYVSSNKNYSYISHVNEVDNEIRIYEYYLNIDLSNRDICIKYFNNELCDNYANNYNNFPIIINEVIKNDGTLYEHVFAKNADNYYLKTSKIMSD